MVDTVEERLQVNVHHPAVSLSNRGLGVTHCLVSVAPRPKAVAVWMEVRFPASLHHLCDGLLDEPIHHGGDAKESLSSVWLWDFYAPYWLGAVTACHQLGADGGPVRFQVGTKFINGHAVNARCPFVALDPLQGPFEVLDVENLVHQG